MQTPNAWPLFVPGKFETVVPNPETEPYVVNSVPQPVETIWGAIEDHLPEHLTWSGIVKSKLPVLLVIPSTWATITGKGFLSLIGPSIGYIFAVVEHPRRMDEIERRPEIVVLFIKFIRVFDHKSAPANKNGFQGFHIGFLGGCSQGEWEVVPYRNLKPLSLLLSSLSPSGAGLR